MFLGILADIHERVSALRRALAEFRALGVEQVISLGDACDTFSPAAGRAAEVAALFENGASSSQ